MFNGIVGLAPSRRGTGTPYISGAYIVNRFGSRVRELLGPGAGTTVVRLAPDAIDAFSIEATVGGRKPDWVRFERDGETIRWDGAEPYGMTGELPQGGWKDWGDWTSGKTHAIRITPEGGPAAPTACRCFWHEGGGGRGVPGVVSVRAERRARTKTTAQRGGWSGGGDTTYL
eukprot:TRINITY_DN3154_c0_g1_i2.p3 TRINITY_DN3154_c0_g1~~TRINITY_DN3154_c0_g1_i2.p3  ORF type:complete len:172 (-),score=34.09 TRINITY_DN3154_c0_g1_i2:40-555(-)